MLQGDNWRCGVMTTQIHGVGDGGRRLCCAALLQANDLLVMREQNYQLGRDNSRLRRRLAELQKVRFVSDVYTS